jgi:hypothetical protein
MILRTSRGYHSQINALYLTFGESIKKAKYLLRHEPHTDVFPQAYIRRPDSPPLPSGTFSPKKYVPEELRPKIHPEGAV